MPGRVRSTRLAREQRAAQAQQAQQERDALRRANEEEITKLSLRASGLWVPDEAEHAERVDVRAAVQRFRAPIEDVETFAKQRFTAVAKHTGLRRRGGGKDFAHSRGYFDFRPAHNVNVTNPIPIMSTDAGALAVELGAVWSLGRPGRGHLLESRAGFFARVLNMGAEEGDEPAEAGYVSLGRMFRRGTLSQQTLNRGQYDFSNEYGRVVLGGVEETEEGFRKMLRKRAELSDEVAVLGRVEQAAAAFTILTEFAADQVGAEAHAIDASALSLALHAART